MTDELPSAESNRDLGERLILAGPRVGPRVLLALLAVMFLGGAVLFSRELGGVRALLANVVYWIQIRPFGVALVTVSFVAGLYCVARIVHWSRARVEVFERGIRVRPGNREVLWYEVQEVCYAGRRPRVHELRLPFQESLQLRVAGGKPVDLANRFQDMSRLVQTVLGKVEPHVVDRALATLREHGRVSFGPDVTVTREGLELGRGGRLLPFERIEHCGASREEVTIREVGGRLALLRAVEMVPNAPMLGRVVELAATARDSVRAVR